MKITVKKDHAGIDLVFEAENVTIVESIEERIYDKLENGDLNFKKGPKRDVHASVLDQYTSLLEDLFYFRNADYNSSKLIDALFEKMPDEEVGRLLFLLTLKYDEQYQTEILQTILKNKQQ